METKSDYFCVSFLANYKKNSTTQTKNYIKKGSSYFEVMEYPRCCTSSSECMLRAAILRWHVRPANSYLAHMLTRLMEYWRKKEASSIVGEWSEMRYRRICSIVIYTLSSCEMQAQIFLLGRRNLQICCEQKLFHKVALVIAAGLSRSSDTGFYQIIKFDNSALAAYAARICTCHALGKLVCTPMRTAISIKGVCVRLEVYKR